MLDLSLAACLALVQRSPRKNIISDFYAFCGGFLCCASKRRGARLLLFSRIRSGPTLLGDRCGTDGVGGGHTWPLGSGTLINHKLTYAPSISISTRGLTRG